MSTLQSSLAIPRRLTPAGCIAAVVTLALAGCDRPSPAAGETPLPSVKVTRPAEKEIIEYAYFTGRLDAEQAVNVQARVTGYLVSVDFTPGAEVEAKQQLFLIDPRPYQAQLDVANSQVALAQAQLELANADLARARDVAKTPGAISQKELDRYAAAQSEAEAQLGAAKANAEAAQLNVEFTKVLSPIDGRVSRNLLTIGNLVKQDTTLLTTVVSQDPMFAYFDIDENTVLKIKRMIQKGKLQGTVNGGDIPVEMGLADEGDTYPHAGTLNFVNNALDPSTGTLQIRGAFPNPAGPNGMRLLTPGMFVRIRLPLSEPFRAMLIPQAALGTDQGSKYVLTVGDDSVVQYRPVRMGPEQPGGMQVVFAVPMVKTREGLQQVETADDGTTALPPGTQTIDSIDADSQIVVSGVQRARPGRKVRATEVALHTSVAAGTATVDPASSKHKAASSGTAPMGTMPMDTAPKGAVPQETPPAQPATGTTNQGEDDAS